MTTLKRGARKGTYGIGALALIAMPGILGTPYPASMAPAATYEGATFGHGPSDGADSHHRNASESVIGGDS